MYLEEVYLFLEKVGDDSKIKYYKILNKCFPDLVKPTKKIFKNKDYPSVKYQNMIYKRLHDIFKKHGIKNRIV